MRPFSPATLLAVLAVLVGCAGENGSATTTTAPGSTTTTIQATTTTAAATAVGPQVTAATTENTEPAAYDLVEFYVELEADYDNPFDQREVTLDAVFTGPERATLELPGFWDGEDSWRLRFTPSQVGTWEYSIVVTDHSGPSEPLTGSLEVAPSDHPGFLRIGNQVDPDYSPRYFAYEDGTPWYGRGHADLDMGLGGPAPGGEGLRKFVEMAESGENYEMWWPMWGSNYIQASYDNYAPAPMKTIDFVVREAEAHGVALVYTIWTHQFLRTRNHDWPDPSWTFNGFSHLTDIDGFFTDPEAWAWQENFYRYTIARWSHSPAILMWQTITEINGTESYEHTDPWHEKVNAYFQQYDPYQHPTTATMSGAVDWPEGHAVMDVPQVHLYHVFGENPIFDTSYFADWTSLMWEREEKPNWIGEYGVPLQRLYPEFMHFANWASLAAGAAATPIEWNDRRLFGVFDDEMKADMRRFADFIEEVPLVVYDPEKLPLRISNPEVRGWGLAGETGGVVWVQDFALDGVTIEEIRADQTVRSGVTVTVDGLAAGSWTLSPYDTWQGVWLDDIVVECSGTSCELPLPDFSSDVAIHLHR